jgi:mono/diheme cytochrome c family protein
MNYPLWDLPGAGLLIAGVAIVHVFISHFAIGGGLFLVLTERKARREQDAGLLAYVERHTRVFVLITLVGGALTGVGIWFTIGLVHPSATATLIATFVWGWAIEWTFFVVEIASALVYYYGWHRLAPAAHVAVGWIYFAAAWLSLAVIDGILSFMLTPGAWIATHSFWDGFLNPTYLPSLVARTAACVGLAGLYAVLTASVLASGELKAKIARYAASRWILPAGIALPLSMAWLLSVANAAGVPVADVFGARPYALDAVFRSALAGSASGYPMAQRALVVTTLAGAAVVLMGLLLLGRRAVKYSPGYAAALMVCGFLSFGGMEFVREDLRKPWVIGQYMYVNGVRAAPAAAGDPFALEAVRQRGVLATALWTRSLPDPADPVAYELARGREVFRLSCSACHTQDGYLSMRRLTRGVSASAAAVTIGRLEGWRHRRMPPFAGTDDERHALAVYLASLGGATSEELRAAVAAERAPVAPAGSSAGAKLFEDYCSVCHAADTEHPFRAKGRGAAELYDLLGRLPTINEAMPAFDGTDAERHTLASYLATVDPGRSPGGER